MTIKEIEVKRRRTQLVVTNSELALIFQAINNYLTAPWQTPSEFTRLEKLHLALGDYIDWPSCARKPTL